MIHDEHEVSTDCYPELKDFFVRADLDVTFSFFFFFLSP